MSVDSFLKKCNKPINIGMQRYAYQCETVVMEPIHGAISIRGYIPHGRGKEPYPNPEKDLIEYYELKIERFTQNAITLEFRKKFKDGSEELYYTNTSFSMLVNTLFEGGEANFWKTDPPVKRFE